MRVLPALLPSSRQGGLFTKAYGPLGPLLSWCRLPRGARRAGSRVASSALRQHTGEAKAAAALDTGLEEEEAGLGVYVHWPYCSRICPYCDFNRYVADHDTIDHERMASAYVRELSFFRRRFFDGEEQAEVTHHGESASGQGIRPDAKRVRSVFFGGGTPSLAKARVMEEVLKSIERQWGLEPDAEITMEANPTSVEVDKLRDFRVAGINRLSIGVQSLNAEDLKYLGRAHSPEDALRAIELGKRIFPRVSFDLIYARHRNQNVDDWRKELKHALSLAGGHISLYTLTLEPGTPFYRRAYEAISPKDQYEDLIADLYEATVSTAAEAGYRQYEASNYAQLNHESRHNLIYWKSGDWIGIGPGAHGRLTVSGRRYAFSQIKQPQKWIKSVEDKGHGNQEMRLLATVERMEELFLNGMRIQEGVNSHRFLQHIGIPMEKALSMDKIIELHNQGFINHDKTGIRPTPKGMALLDSLLPHLLAAWKLDQHQSNVL